MIKLIRETEGSGPRLSLVNASFACWPLFRRPVHRTAFDHRINGALESNPSIRTQLDF
jgi:hypothetical protein